MALGASMALILKSGCYLSGLMCVMSLFLVCIIYFIFPGSLWLIESLIVFFLMSGIALLLGSCTEKKRHGLIGAILFGAFCAGVMSFYEIHFLVELYQGRWAHEGARLGLVSESAYFALMNSLRILGFVLFLVLVVFFFKARSGGDGGAYKRVFWSYLVCALFENTLNSLPDNQMFFISLGVFFV
ncbi:hypothetical protein SAMN04490204_2327 [Pseudomonas thivervalensis]|nr:hypothetical protein SAMN04490204_2327 [Pseudomonas thivervalensis]